MFHHISRTINLISTKDGPKNYFSPIQRHRLYFFFKYTLFFKKSDKRFVKKSLMIYKSHRFISNLRQSYCRISNTWIFNPDSTYDFFTKCSTKSIFWFFFLLNRSSRVERVSMPDHVSKDLMLKTPLKFLKICENYKKFLRNFFVTFEESICKLEENFALISRKFWEIFMKFMRITEKILWKLRKHLAGI